MEGIIGVLNLFDRQLQSGVLESKKKEILLTMFLIECKYNLDILDLIRKDCIQGDSQINEIINLLSIKGIETVITESDLLAGDSFLIELGKDLITRLREINKKESTNANLDDSVVFDIYKRILVLKSISKLTQPYSAVKDIKILLRLKHLKGMFLILSKHKS